MQAGIELVIEQLIKLIKLIIMFFQILLVLIQQLNKLIKYLFQQQKMVQVHMGYQNMMKKKSPLEGKKKPVSGQPSKCLCSICFDSKAESDMFRGGECNHPFCTDCISKYVASQIQQNILNVYCPIPNCSMELKPQHLQTLLPKEVIDRWESARLESSISWWEKTYCPCNNCSVLLVNDGREVVTMSECPSCHRLFCAQCNVPWHAEMNCVEFQKLKSGKRENDLDMKFLELAKGKMWQKCPKCYMYVQRCSGCEHMTCRCGCQFCYHCGENWKFAHLCDRRRSS